MARNQIFIDAPPQTVFELLGDASTYAVWVVGAHEIRSSDPNWPAPRAGFEHTLGIPPVAIMDDTTVIESRPPARLQLHARARPLPSARITLDLQPERRGTRVTMTEDVSMLRRLKALVESA